MYSAQSLPYSFLQARSSSRGNRKPKSPQNSSYCGPVIPLDVDCRNLRISSTPTPPPLTAVASAASSSFSRRSGCACSPSTHEGAFKCSLHRKKCRDNVGISIGSAGAAAAPQKLRRSLSNSPCAIRSEVARRALMPSSSGDCGLQKPRRIQPERAPSRLSRVTMAATP